MKRKIHKIWGVGLTLVIAASLILWTAPVSAGTLSWGSEDIPDELELGTNVVDIAVSADGGVIYAAVTGGLVELETAGTSTAEWSTMNMDGLPGTEDDPFSGSYSVNLTCTGTGLDEWSAAKVPYWETLATLVALTATKGSYTVLDVAFNVWATSNPVNYAMLWVDEDADGTIDTRLTGGFDVDGADGSVISLAGAGWLEAYKTSAATWQLRDYDAGVVSTYTGACTSKDVNDIVSLPAYVGDAPCAGAIVVYVGVGYTANAEPAYVDDITINGGTYPLEPGLVGSSVYRSTNGGESWSTLSNPSDAVAPKLVAVAPDDEDYIAVVADSKEVYISDDAGATWDPLVTTTLKLGLDVINDIALSATKGGSHYVAVAGEGETGGEIWYYKVAGVGAEWENASDELLGFEGFDAADFAGAVAFSPNFASDEVMVAVTAKLVEVDPDVPANVLFQIFSFDQTNWNEKAGFDGYPVDLTQETLPDSFTLDSASIALSPDYLGSDDSMRLAFVGLALGGGIDVEDTTGIQRIEDDDNDVLKDGVNIHSIAYDGTDLVAGRYDSTTVYRCADPLASSPSAKGSASLKSPGGENKVVVAFAGDKVVAGTSGDESAFAVSGDEGKTFNDISLIDTALTNLSDVAVSPDGSNVYLVTDDGNDLSLWRYASAWERVLAIDDKAGFIIRLAPDDADVVYLADAGGVARTIYYSAKGGDVKWFTRISTETIDDLAVEGDGSVVYVATGGYVSKSTNGGFTWGSKKSSKLDAISMIVSLGEDLLLAGSKDGKAAYTTDGNSSWSKLSGGMTRGVVSVIADGLDEGDLVVAVTDAVAEEGDDFIFRWDWDDEEWDGIGTVPDDDDEDTDVTYECYGIALQDGVLYAVGTDDSGTDSRLFRSLNPTSDDPSWNTVDSEKELFTVTPSALRVSVSDTTVQLWAIDATIADQDLFSYKDTLAAVAPTLLGPADGFLNKMNPISGAAFDITFSWERPSKNVDAYDFVIALDSDFDEVVLDQVREKDSSKVGVVAGPNGPTLKVTGAASSDFSVEFMPDTTYYWKVRVDAVSTTLLGPIRSPWSEVRSFKIEEAPVPEPVTVAPTPEITIAVPPAPQIVLPAPEIIIPTPEIVLPAPQVTLPPSPAPVAPIPGWALYAIIFIGAVLVIALIVLILRTRRPV